MKKKILILGTVLTLLSVLMLPGAVIAGDGTTDVNGGVTNEYAFSAPSQVDLGTMAPSETPHKANSAGGSLKGTNATGYNVTGVDEKVPNKGYMVSGLNVLGNKLQISNADADYVSANETKTFVSTAGPTDTTFSLYTSQLVTYTDPAAAGYSITITFTVTEKT